MSRSKSHISMCRVNRAFRLAVCQADELVDISKLCEEILTVHLPAISRWRISQHLDHLTKSGNQVMIRIQEILEDPDRHSFNGGPNWKGRIVLLFKYIPRGTGKAPESSAPKCRSVNEVREEVLQYRKNIGSLEDVLQDIAVCKGHAVQPQLGQFTPLQHLVFLTIHNHHHAKIIRDLMKHKRTSLGVLDRDSADA